MVDKSLEDWVNKQKNSGYTDEQIKNNLISNGHSITEVQKILNKGQNKKRVKDFFKPTPLKLFFPILILILIISSIIVNSVYLPKLGKNVCSSLNQIDALNQEYKKSVEILNQNNANPDEIVTFLKNQETNNNLYIKNAQENRKEIQNYAKPITIGNIYFIGSMIYKLNPFFPIPCETIFILDEKYNAPRCTYFIEKEDFDCINDYIEGKRNQSLSSIFMFGENKAYNKVNIFDIIINIIILVGLIYIIICFITLLYKYANSNNNNRISKLIIISSLSLPLLAILFVQDIENLFAFYIIIYPFILLFVILTFVRDERKSYLILTISIILFIILLILGIFATNIIINREYSSQNSSDNIGNIDYKIIYCNNTRILSYEEKIERFGNGVKFINETWKVCFDIDCDKICEYKDKTRLETGVSLRGDTPSVICKCYK